MNAIEIIKVCSDKGVKLVVTGNKLRAVISNGHVLPDDMRMLIRENKSILIDELVSGHQNKKGVILKIDPWSCVRGLRILPEDRAFIMGFVAGRGLDEEGEHELLKSYSMQWRIAEGNRKYGGRYAANTWLREKA